jgi:hypothetical protein
MPRFAAIVCLLLLTACQTTGSNTELLSPKHQAARDLYLGLPENTETLGYRGLPQGRFLYKGGSRYRFMYNVCRIEPYRLVTLESCQNGTDETCRMVALGDRSVAGLEGEQLDKVIRAYEILLDYEDQVVTERTSASLGLARLFPGSRVTDGGKVYFVSETSCGGTVSIILSGNRRCDGTWTFVRVRQPTPRQPIMEGRFRTECLSGGRIDGSIFMESSKEGLVIGETGAGQFVAIIGDSVSERPMKANLFRLKWDDRVSHGGFEKIEELKGAFPG